MDVTRKDLRALSDGESGWVGRVFYTLVRLRLLEHLLYA